MASVVEHLIFAATTTVTQPQTVNFTATVLSGDVVLVVPTQAGTTANSWTVDGTGIGATFASLGKYNTGVSSTPSIEVFEGTATGDGTISITFSSTWNSGWQAFLLRGVTAGSSLIANASAQPGTSVTGPSENGALGQVVIDVGMLRAASIGTWNLFDTYTPASGWTSATPTSGNLTTHGAAWRVPAGTVESHNVTDTGASSYYRMVQVVVGSTTGAFNATATVSSAASVTATATKDATATATVSSGASVAATGVASTAGALVATVAVSSAATVTATGSLSVPTPTEVARAYSPTGARALLPLVAATAPGGIDEVTLTRTSVLMAALSETHPTHARTDCSEADDEIVREDLGAVHLWINGVDCTYLRGKPIVIRRWESEVPFGDTAAAFEFPQLNPWDADEAGDLEFLTKDARVHVGIVNGSEVRRVWSGFLDARGNGIGEGEDYAREAKGTLWAAQHTIREPFPFTEAIDIGVLIARTLNDVTSRRWAEMPATPIGIVTLTRGARDQTHWEYVQELLSEAWTDDGRQWTLFEAAPEVFTLRLKPAPATVDATVAYGTPGVEIDLRVDESTRVDAVYARAIAPNKGGWANIFYPALEILNPPPYPNSDASENLSTDAASDTGTGVTDWQTRVVEIGTFDTPAISGTMSAAWEDVAREVQRSIGVTVDGSVGPQTWNATFDRGGEGIDMRPLRLPLALKNWVWPTLHTTTGVVSGPNPNYTGTASVPRMIAVDLGADKTKTQGRAIARNILSVYGEAEAFGTATWSFDPNETDRTRLTHLSNVKVLGHEGEDRTLMVVRKTVELEASEDGPVYVVTTTLDQRARDAMAVEDLLEQRRSAQTDPSRRPGNPPRSSRQVADQRTPWDSESPCGVLRRTAVNGDSGLWSIITLPFAEVGKIARIDLTADHPFAFTILASLRVTENDLKAIYANPLTSNDWRDNKPAADEFGIIEAWGEPGNRCGYSPKTEADGGSFTGRFILDTPVDYWTETPPYVSVGIFMAASGFISGRFYPAYEGA